VDSGNLVECVDHAVGTHRMLARPAPSWRRGGVLCPFFTPWRVHCSGLAALSQRTTAGLGSVVRYLMLRRSEPRVCPDSGLRDFSCSGDRGGFCCFLENGKGFGGR
jgi:hypothetical protein